MEVLARRVPGILTGSVWLRDVRTYTYMLQLLTGS